MWLATPRHCGQRTRSSPAVATSRWVQCETWPVLHLITANEHHFPNWGDSQGVHRIILQGSQRFPAPPERRRRSLHLLLTSCVLSCGCLCCQTLLHHLESTVFNNTLQCEKSHWKFLHPYVSLAESAATWTERRCKLGFCSLLQISPVTSSPAPAVCGRAGGASSLSLQICLFQ